MKLLLLLALGFLSALSSVDSGGVPKVMAKRIMEMTLLSDCWGKQNMIDYMMLIKEKADVCLGREPELTEDDLFEAQLPRGPKAASAAAEEEEGTHLEGPRHKPMDPRGSRQVSLLADDDDDNDDDDDVDDDDSEEGPAMMMTPKMMRVKMEKMQKLKMRKVLKVSNLTCTMKEVGMWNEDESVNMGFFRNIFSPVGKETFWSPGQTP